MSGRHDVGTLVEFAVQMHDTWGWHVLQRYSSSERAFQGLDDWSDYANGRPIRVVKITTTTEDCT